MRAAPPTTPAAAPVATTPVAPPAAFLPAVTSPSPSRARDKARTAAAALGATVDAAAAKLGAVDDPAALRRLERLAHLLDGAFRLPGTRWRFGLDGIAGLVPGVGDSVTALVGLYMLLEARRAGAPNGLLARMAGNVAVDWVVGSVPVVGDLFDFAFKAHRRNADLLRRHLQDRAAVGAAPPRH